MKNKKGFAGNFRRLNNTCTTSRRQDRRVRVFGGDEVAGDGGAGVGFRLRRLTRIGDLVSYGERTHAQYVLQCKSEFGDQNLLMESV